MGAGDGMLTQVSLDYTSYATVTAANGAFSLDSLPNTDLAYFASTLRMQQFVYIDPVTQFQTILYFNPLAVSLQPGETQELGDLYAF
jgi:hypothetical protein